MWIAPERRGLRRWIVPGLVLAAAAAVGAVLVADGRTTTGLVAAGVLAGYACLLGYRRNEPAMPYGEGSGGYRARAHLRSAAVTGDVLTVAVVGAVVVQALRGADITPYVWPAALAGVVYTLSALFGGRGL
ncbi:ABC transporter permease [Actinomadura hibisca]|uniref:ABC transporter permease n=1 Tax=Actinomadura hibisca TaxID=68565 RepID=UPI0008330294|nr:ABC transporter permease [Actinomadura hibisca]